VHWAHRVAERFPDGQLYVNLRGFDPSGPAMTPAEAVRGFLDALGAAPHQIPVSLSAQVGLYRSLLAGKRVLVALDNAASAEQVRPLLPGSPGCLVVVTSRNQLTSLVAAEGARPLPLDLLSADEARQLLARRLGADRVAAEPGAVEDIVTLCAELRDTRRGLDALNRWGPGHRRTRGVLLVVQGARYPGGATSVGMRRRSPVTFTRSNCVGSWGTGIMRQDA
jgi:hypothetical protein